MPSDGLPQPPTPHEAGYVDQLSFAAISGWAWDRMRPDEPVEIEILDGERVVLTLLADQYRPDLHQLGLGDGRHGFAIAAPADFFPQSRHHVRIRRAADGLGLDQGERWIERGHAGLDAAAAAQLHERIEAAIAAATTPEDLALPLAVVAHGLGTLVNAQIALAAGKERAARRLLAELPGQAALQGRMAALIEGLARDHTPLYFEPAESPLVSLIIPVCDEFAAAHACLAAVQQAGGRQRFEIILADDASGDETLLAGLMFSGGVRVLRHPRRLGMAASCNLAAAGARGAFLLFLSPHMRVTPGWLDALADSFETVPELGLAGARLLDAEGVVDECGGVVWRLGDTWPCGRGETAADPAYQYLRDADFVSLGALMLPSRLFADIGGFDAAYAPGVHLAADLAFRVAERGLRVVVQPACTITRLRRDGGPHRPEEVRRFQRTWSERLTAHRYTGELAALEAERAVTRRILYLAETMPAPDRPLTALLQPGSKLSLMVWGQNGKPSAVIAQLQKRGVECLIPPYAASLEAWLEASPVPPDVVWLAGAASVSSYAALLRETLPRVRLVASLANPAILRDGPLEGLAVLDQVVLSSRQEADALARALPGIAISVVPLVIEPHPILRAFEQRFGVAFIGDFHHVGDVEAARHLAETVMPKLRSRMATHVRQAEAYLIGPHMPAELAALQAADLHVIGYVPVLADMLHRLRCTLAPYPVTQQRDLNPACVLDSFAHGLPCVMTTAMADALALPESLAWLAAGSVDEMADKIIRLHEDAALNASLAEAGLALIAARHGADLLQAALLAAVAPPRRIRLGFEAAEKVADEDGPLQPPDYRGEIEYLAPGHVRGWAFDCANPGRKVTLLARFPGSSRDMRLVANTPRPFLPEPAGQSGFELAWNPFDDGFDVDITTISDAAPHFDLLRDPPSMPHPLADAIPADCVTIVIPIYGGLVETMCCLRSVRVARNATKLRVLLIDDCSPDAALSLAVAQFAAQSGFLHRRLTRNLGFVGTANLGMAAFAEDDVVLLNADTEVPDFWLDRLHEAAYRHPRIASVTPMSNNASVMSIPVMGGRPELPGGRRLAELDDLCRDLDDGVLHDTPTAHGFCMYIRRDALDDVGLFDAELFGRGYGEENDFSLRARARGWRNVVTGGLFVRHTGSVSFSTAQEALLARNLALLNARHPGYEQEVAAFIAIDPLRRLRARVQLALWKQAGPVVVMVVLGLPGGTMRHVASLSRDIEKAGRVVLWVRSDSEHAVTLSDPAGEAVLRYAGRRGEAELLGDLLALDPGFVHVHHVLDLSSGIASLLLRSGLPIIITAHDYFFGCPRVTLLDAGGGFCGAPAAEFCAPCLDASPHEALHPSLRPLASDGVKWRGHWAPLLARAHQIIVPSRAAAFYMGRMFEGLDFSVRQHPAGLLASAPKLDCARDPNRIAVIGAIGPHKGSALLHDLIAHCHRHEPELRFVIIGHTDRDALLRRYGNVELTGKYEPDDALAMIAKAGCVCALFLSPWPETYCFTLSEALLAGLVPVALDRGAIGERLRDLGQGIVLPPEVGVAGIVAALREAATRELLPILPPLRIDGVYDDLFADYYAPVPEVTHVPLRLGPGHGVMGDLWCERRFELPLYLRLEADVRPAALVLQLWNHVSHPGQRVVAWIEGAAPQRGFLPEGEVTDLRLELPPGRANLLWLHCAFERVDPLGGGDTRLAAATLFGVALVMPDGEIIACRALPAPAAGDIGLAVTAPNPAPAMAEHSP